MKDGVTVHKWLLLSFHWRLRFLRNDKESNSVFRGSKMCCVGFERASELVPVVGDSGEGERES